MSPETTSPFDPETFMQMSVSAQMETRVTPCPPGEYAAKIDKVTPRMTTGGKPLIDLVWEVLDPNVLAATGRSKVTARQTIWLDFENGTLLGGPGKNISLGRVREAVGQNTGANWQPAMLLGQTAKVKVINEPDKDDPATIYDRVIAVTKL